MNRSVLRVSWALLAAGCGRAAEPAGRTTVPTEDFARPADFSLMQLSPDGKYVAFLREMQGDPRLFFLEIDTMKPARVDPGVYPMTEDQMSVLRAEWVSDTRVIFANTLWDRFIVGTTAVDRDGGRARVLTGSLAEPLSEFPLRAYDVIHRFGDARQNVLMLDEGRNELDGIRPNVVRIDTLNGQAATVAKNPGNVRWWATDFGGVVRVGYTVDKDGGRGAIYREAESAPWRELRMDDARGEIRPLKVNDDGTIDVVALSAKDRWTVFRCEPGSGRLGAPLAEDEVHDTAAPETLGETGPIYSERKRRMVGIRHVNEAAGTRWLDPEFAAMQAALDGALRGMVNLPVQFSRDDRHALVLSYSDKDPGTYYRFDLEKRQLRLVAKRMERIKPAQMADMFPVKYAARDGLTIRAYLTVPRGRKPEKLPLVVMPHGGPWARDQWEFDPLVQMLANRGYAVLQPNFRGSVGYGQEFYEKGRREFGRAVQQDIEDGTRWAIDAGIADPARVAIVGASFGGYCALFGLGRTPELYRCGIAIAAVTDWAEIIEGRNREEYRLAYRHWVRQLGDPRTERAALAEISPVTWAKEIRAPLLVIHGKDDRTVPVRQARMLVGAMEAAGLKPETLYFSGEGHTTAAEKNRIEQFRRIEEFLGRHLKP